MDAPSAAVRDPAHLFDVDVHHVARPLRDDSLPLTVAVSGRVDEPAPVEAELEQDARDSSTTDWHAFEIQFEFDSCRRPLVLPSHPLDTCNYR